MYTVRSVVGYTVKSAVGYTDQLPTLTNYIH